MKGSSSSLWRISIGLFLLSVGYFANAALPPAGFNLYELSTRPWLYNLSLKYEKPITLGNIPEPELQRFVDMGMDMVWFMGMWELGPYGLNYDRTNPGLLQHYAQVLPGYTTADIIGSPYAITEYRINPEIGTDADLIALRKRLNALGLLLMLDFVPNHSAVDCPWTSSAMDYYVRAPKGSTPPYDSNVYLPDGIAYGSAGWGGAWMDTAQLNYWNASLVQARIEQLKVVASRADGIRCDMAYLVLNSQIQQNWGSQLSSWGYSAPAQEFWKVAIDAVKQDYPEVVFLAEVYDPFQPTLQGLGFDYTYDKDVYDRLGSGDLNSVRSWISGNSVAFLTHSAHFLSNHDQSRAVNYFGSWYRADAAALVTYTLPGMRFFWEGQWEGYADQLDIHLRREPHEPTVADVDSFYHMLLPIISDPVFRSGSWEYLDVFGDDAASNLMAWKWAYNGEHRLCILNFSPWQSGGNVIVSDAAARNGNDTIPVTDLISGVTYYRSAESMRTSGLFAIVDSNWAQIFKY